MPIERLCDRKHRKTIFTRSGRIGVFATASSPKARLLRGRGNGTRVGRRATAVPARLPDREQIDQQQQDEEAIDDDADGIADLPLFEDEVHPLTEISGPATRHTLPRIDRHRIHEPDRPRAGIAAPD